ncbi:hypothetical protein [uncultured Bacteroides sp.]|jgi:hypothetical protein|uniref:hypothetical protein n=1 Tax=uncultured Bacteroides sp. TaxID=162156 RepID=UPI00280B6609|nr:hypothetical protein [uncultured Bacteroides sp.]
MYKIKTSELLLGKSIVKELINIDVIKNISDDLFETKHHYLMVAYSLEYKIEFSFDKANNVCQYIMVEENEVNREKQNINIEFIDDISIFGKHIDVVIDNFKMNILQNDSVKIGNIELYFSENKVDSLYYFPKQNISNNHLNS